MAPEKILWASEANPCESIRSIARERLLYRGGTVEATTLATVEDGCGSCSVCEEK